jgi:hypothetical protein
MVGTGPSHKKTQTQYPALRAVPHSDLGLTNVRAGAIGGEDDLAHLHWRSGA